jgi:hypothetical protein
MLKLFFVFLKKIDYKGLKLAMTNQAQQTIKHDNHMSIHGQPLLI